MAQPIRHDEGAPEATSHELVVIGCGNLLRSDDAVGPIAIRHLWERMDGADNPGELAERVLLVDGGTAGMDVAFKMRGAGRVILIDAAATGAEPGTLYRVPGSELEQLPPLEGLHSHQFRWDHALAFAHWLLGDECPTDVEVFLIEAANTDPGWDLTEPVAAAMEQVLDLVWAEMIDQPTQSPFAGEGEGQLLLELTDQGYLRYDAETAARFFPSDAVLAAYEPATGELLVLPVVSADAGGLLVKQRNASGDRAVLVHEHLPLDYTPGPCPATWDTEAGALRLRLPSRRSADTIAEAIAP